MNTQKISKLVRKSKRAIILEDETGVQWLGDGQNFYIVDERLKLTEDNVLAVLNIDFDEENLFNVSYGDDMFCPSYVKQTPDDTCDAVLHPVISVSWGGELITLFRDEDEKTGVMLPQNAIAAADNKRGLRFFLRRMPDMQPVVMIGENMLYSAILNPVNSGCAEKIYEAMRDAMAGLDYVTTIEQEDNDD